ncbi:MAG TPA: hypothetical protein VFA11_16280 [Acidimicrobiales bacterium]|nr:hypothetical protein [Acidimicrobiales bacterium]
MGRTADLGAECDASPPAEVVDRLAHIAAEARALAATRGEIEGWAAGPGRSSMAGVVALAYCQALAAAEITALALVDALASALAGTALESAGAGA